MSLGGACSYEPGPVPYTQPAKARKYTPDFVLPNGIVIEAKGYLRPTDRTKMLWVKQNNPQLDIRFVFNNPNNKIYKGSKTTYAMWAEANGFPWAEKLVPSHWLTEKPSKASIQCLKKLQLL